MPKKNGKKYSTLYLKKSVIIQAITEKMNSYFEKKAVDVLKFIEDNMDDVVAQFLEEHGASHETHLYSEGYEEQQSPFSHAEAEKDPFVFDPLDGVCVSNDCVEVVFSENQCLDHPWNAALALPFVMRQLAYSVANCSELIWRTKKNPFFQKSDE